MESPQNGIMNHIELEMNQNSDQNATNIINICDLDKYTNNTVCTQANNCNNIDENTTLNHEKQMHQILETVLSINMYVKRIDSRLSKMEKKITEKAVQETQPIDDEFVCLFPLTLIDDLTNIELKIANNEDFSNKMVGIIIIYYYYY